jgi:hypothetical protein
MDFKEMESDVVNWVHVTQDRNQRRGSCECDEPSGSVKCWEILEWRNKQSGRSKYGPNSVKVLA